LALIAIAVAKVFAYDIWRLERGYKILGFFALGMLLFAVSFVYQRDQSGRARRPSSVVD
jgi:uncharacterized membrane protein